MTDNNSNRNQRIHGTGMIIAIPVGVAIWGAAYAIDGWSGVGILACVTVLVGVALALDER